MVLSVGLEFNFLLICIYHVTRVVTATFLYRSFVLWLFIIFQFSSPFLELILKLDSNGLREESEIYPITGRRFSKRLASDWTLVNHFHMMQQIFDSSPRILDVQSHMNTYL